MLSNEKTKRPPEAAIFDAVCIHAAEKTEQEESYGKGPATEANPVETLRKLQSQIWKLSTVNPLVPVLSLVLPQGFFSKF